MNVLRSVLRRLRGDDVAALAAEVTQVRELVMKINHDVASVRSTVMELNHDVRAGAERSLPLFLGHTEQMRTDAETAVAAAQVIERQLALLEDRISRLAPGPSGPPDA